MDENSRFLYDHRADEIYEGLIEQPYDQLLNQLESTLDTDHDAWRKAILQAWRHTSKILHEAENLFTEEKFDEHCTAYRMSFQESAKSEFRRFIKSQAFIPYRRCSLKEAHAMLSVELDEVKEIAKNLHAESILPLPAITLTNIIGDERVLYSAMQQALQEEIKQLSSRIRAESNISSASLQDKLMPVKWRGTEEQLKTLHEQLIDNNCLPPDSGLIEHFQRNAVLSPIVWQKKFTLLIYLIRRLQARKFFTKGLCLEKLAKHFVRPSKIPWTGFHQASHNYSTNRSTKPQGHIIVDTIISLVGSAPPYNSR